MKDLRTKTIRAGVMNLAGRTVAFVLRIGSLMILGRLLEPTDYGLVGMVTAFTGVLNMFGGFGLFQAAIQRDSLTSEQASTLFWLNVLFGSVLTLATIALAPAVSSFYHEPRLLPITMVVAIGFVLTAAGVQHGAHLQRQMRFGRSAVIDIVALTLAVAVAITMALEGFGYWAVVSSTVTLPLATTVGLWLATGWIPGLPRRHIGIRSMLHFGGTMTLNGLVTAVTGNLDKLLLGRFWGAEGLGIYGRAYHLVTFPNDNINVTIGEVAFAALSRTKDDPERFRRYFMKGYSLVVGLTLPLTVVCALFAEDLVAVALGPKWSAAADIFRVLAPTIMVFAICNPLGWLMNALGLVKRGLYISLAAAPILMVGVALGVPYGPKGVAVAYSTVMTAKIVPIAAWALHGTGIRVMELLQALGRPMGASIVAAVISYAVQVLYGWTLPLLPRLALEMASFGAVYLYVLLFVAGQRSVYLDLIRAAKPSPSC